MRMLRTKKRPQRKKGHSQTIVHPISLGFQEPGLRTKRVPKINFFLRRKMPRKYFESTKSLVKSTIYGSWSDGSDVFKDARGYYIVQLDIEKDKFYKQYLKGFTPTFVHTRGKR